MKIRIKGNSVRYRLSKTELDLFAKEGYVEDQTAFPNGTFCYAIQKLFDGKNLDASFTGNKLTMFVPHDVMTEWTETDKVGFDYNLSVGDNKTLFLLIEKDFKCIDGVETEDQSDYFDHPTKTC